ncbi:MAG: hypothetical protein K2P79_05625, partial [Sphingomonas sp.]|nr:hypothetical protein [Sphingomonas sp.]
QRHLGAAERAGRQQDPLGVQHVPQHAHPPVHLAEDAGGGQPQVVDTIKLVSDKGTKTVKGLDNLLHVDGGGVLPRDLSAKVMAGALEQSNVNLTQALVDMIQNQRSYEVQANLIKETKNLDESSAQLMRLPG